MKRVARTTTIAVVTAITASFVTISVPSTAHAGVGDIVYIDGVEYTDGGIVPLGGGDSTITDDVVETVIGIIGAAGSCVPRSHTTTIYDPAAHVYYGALNSIYIWEDLAEAEITGCTNPVRIRVQMFDQPLNGVDSAAVGAAAEGRGYGRAGAIAELMQRYNNVSMSTGLSYHQLTTVASATQSDGKTTTAWCAKKSWTYLATLAGPSFVGSTPTEKVKCGA